MIQKISRYSCLKDYYKKEALWAQLIRNCASLDFFLFWSHIVFLPSVNTGMCICYIENIILCPTVRKEKLPFLDVLVHEFLTELNAVFGNVITPKCHYLIHYPRLMSMFGPLRSLWCMKFEGKHQYFKNIASNCCNFINIASTLSNRYQFK